MDGRTKALVAASVAGLVAAAGLVLGSPHAQAEEEDAHVPCHGINKCKGVGDCGGKGHSCAGKNECAGQGYVELEKDTCLKIQGGRLTPEVEPS